MLCGVIGLQYDWWWDWLGSRCFFLSLGGGRPRIGVIDVSVKN